jgi:trigger factor
VHLGDQAVIDVRGISAEEVFIERQGLSVVVSEERGVIVPGLASELVGAMTGVEQKASIALPADFSIERLRGQQAEFVMTVRELKEKRLPAVDDEFAKSVGDFADVGALRERTRQAVREGKEKEARDRLEERVIGKLVESSVIEFPAVMLREEEELLLNRMSDRLKRQGLDLDTYLRVTKKSRVDFLKEAEPQARQRIQSGLALGKVADAEGVSVDLSEVEAEIERMSAEYGEKATEVRRTFSSDSMRRSVRALLLERKTLARLVDIATSSE